MRWFLVLLLLPLSMNAQTFRSVTSDELIVLLAEQSDKPRIINFWATWCKPCVEELPEFLQLADERADDVELILVSLDFPSQVDLKLKPFIAERGITYPVWHVTSTDYNKWIDRVTPEWGGSIPATLIIPANDKGTNRWFHEGQLTKAELEKALEPFFAQ